MRYVMVTHWPGHWDRLPKGLTRYSYSMLRGDMSREKIQENTKTIFIKINQLTNAPEQAWEGMVGDFKMSNVINFRVTITKKIKPPPELSSLSEGWYLDSEGEDIPNELVLPLFSTLENTTKWEEFEHYSTVLLRLLGLNEIIEFKKQRGTADGFFKIRNLAVIYDPTLADDFIKEKKQQIDNYVAQLNDRIEYGDTIIDVSKEHNKQVWIITKNTNRLIKNVNGVKVKEVGIKSLIDVYFKRITQGFDEETLVRYLIDI